MTINRKPAGLAGQTALGAIAAIALCAAAATGPALAASKGASIDGAWKVTNVVITGANPATIASPLENLTIYSHGHYATVANQGDKPRTAAPPYKTPGKPTDAEKLAKYEEWAPIAAQAGTYELKGTTLSRTPTVAKNVGAVGGGPITSEIKTLSADTLVLVTKSPPGQPAREQTVTYTRVK